MVFEATYLVAVLTAGQISLCCGQYRAKLSKVLRPINKSERLVLKKKWSDSRRAKQGIPPPNDTSPLANASYYKLGTSMADNSPPKDAGGFFTVEDAAKTVLAHPRTLDEIAIAWHGMDDRKRIVEKLVRQTSGSSNQLLNLI